MSRFDRKDSYYRRAKMEGYRSRAAYKLMQINDRFHVIRRGDRVVDLGCAPGGWSQVARKIVGTEGKVVGIDLKDVAPLDDVIFIAGDVFDDDAIRSVQIEIGGRSDVLLSDMSPQISGHYDVDHSRSVHLAERVLDLCRVLLRGGGNCVVKVFQGDMFPDLLTKYRDNFSRLKIHCPDASRSSSSEVYLVCWDFRRQQGDGR